MDFPVTGMLRERGGTAAMRLSVLHFAMSLNITLPSLGGVP
jgi:hypothetical protein